MKAGIYSASNWKHVVPWIIVPIPWFAIVYVGRYFILGGFFDAASYLALNIYYILAAIMVGSIFRDFKKCVLLQFRLQRNAETTMAQHLRFTGLIAHVDADTCSSI